MKNSLSRSCEHWHEGVVVFFDEFRFKCPLCEKEEEIRELIEEIGELKTALNSKEEELWDFSAYIDDKNKTIEKIEREIKELKNFKRKLG